jgi:hypothetical protein
MRLSRDLAPLNQDLDTVFDVLVLLRVPQYVRGVLGNKCAGQHNLKRERHFLQVIFWHSHQQYMYFFAALYLLSDGGGKLLCNMVGATPYKLFLKVPWINKQLASSDFTFSRR